MIRGRKPKAEHRHRVRPVHEWAEVPDIEFEDGPELPPVRQWPELTRQWWEAVSRMPHCVLWTESDWRFAIDTAVVAAAFHNGDLKQAAELRQRERVLGMTAGARLDLRIRYVEPVIDEPSPGVSALEQYRKRLVGEGAA